MICGDAQPVAYASPPDAIEPVAHARGSDRRLDLPKQLAATKTTPAGTAIQRQIDATDRRIDALVYELYGLTDDEIRIVEGATV